VTRRITTRRVAAAAGIALAMLALSACRDSPNAAAYVGDTTITEQRVTEIVDDAAKLKADDVQTAANSSDAKAKEDAAKLVVPTRQAVVHALVLDQVCGDMQARQGFKDAPVTKEQVVQGLGMPAKSIYADVLTSSLACLQGIPATNATPTPADLREVYDNGVKAGAIDPTGAESSFEALSAQFAQDPQLAAALGTRAALAEELKKSDVSVNPRYRELTYPILSFEKGPALEIVLGQQLNVIDDNA
jgi:hypothetical protein